MIGVVYNGIRAPLAADSTISTACGTNIWRDLAPENTPFPYCVLNVSAGGDTNLSPRTELDVDVTVKFVCTTALEAMNLAGAARDALHNTKPTLTDGWAAYDCQHETIISYTEIVNKRAIYHAGGIYRLRATKDG